MSKYILALDQGTTSSRAIVFDREGSMLSVSQREFEQIFPQPGWVEHDANEIWSSQVGVASEAIARMGVPAERHRRHRHHEPARDDRRVEPQDESARSTMPSSGRTVARRAFCDQLREKGHVETFQKKTGLVIDAYFSGTKVRWILDNVPGAREAADRGELAFGTIDAWLMWKLTNGKLPHHRRDQRFPHAALQHSYPAMGR